MRDFAEASGDRLGEMLDVSSNEVRDRWPGCGCEYSDR